MKLDLHSQPFAASGGMHADAAKRAMGRPPLDPWALFLRETLQNSWDARITPDGSIDFAVDYSWLSRRQLAFLRTDIFKSLPPEGLDLVHVLADQDVALLTVTDRGTRGLTGPTRADVSSAGRSDFVDFARNTGRASSREVGGGTYGFGKGVLFTASVAETIIVYTRTTDENDRPVSRLLAIGNGANYDHDGKQFTGRHIWGVKDIETGVEPLTGEAADAVATILGLTRLTPGTTGTAIAVVAPAALEDSEDSDRAILERIAGAATQWAWPHIVDATIRFEFTHEGQVLTNVPPEQDPVLRRYVEAYRAANAAARGRLPEPSSRLRVVPIAAKRPVLPLGQLATRYFTASSVDGVSPVKPNAVALMRKPRMIVRYLDVAPDPGGRSFAGVFVAHDAVDDRFADAEPVAHDDWAADSLRIPKGYINPVRIALGQIRDDFKRQVAAALVPEAGNSSAALPQLAQRLGALLMPAPGGSASVPIVATGRRADRTATTVSPRTKTGIKLNGRPTLRVEGGRILAAFPVRVTNGDPSATFVAEPRVVLENGVAETSAPEGAEIPEVLDWRNLEGGILAEGPLLVWGEMGTSDLVVRIYQPRHTAISVAVRKTS